MHTVHLASHSEPPLLSRNAEGSGSAAGPKALEVPSVCSALLSIAQLDALIGEVQCIIVVSTIRRAFCLQE